MSRLTNGIGTVALGVVLGAAAHTLVSANMSAKSQRTMKRNSKRVMDTAMSKIDMAKDIMSR